jgi:hypothetical protein
MQRCLILFGLVALLGGCSSSHYYWGHYEGQIYQMYNEPDQSSVVDQVTQLENDLRKAQSKGMLAPPGVQAHLGYLYFQLGKYDQAREAFFAEKEAFPESAVLMDRFIEKLEEAP